MAATPNSTAAAIDRRLVLAGTALDKGGYYEEALALYLRFRDDRWRLLTEYLELMATAGYDPAHIDLIRDA